MGAKAGETAVVAATGRRAIVIAGRVPMHSFSRPPHHCQQPRSLLRDYVAYRPQGAHGAGAQDVPRRGRAATCLAHRQAFERATRSDREVFAHLAVELAAQLRVQSYYKPTFTR